MPSPTLVEGVTVPNNWTVNRRGSRHVRSLANQVANGEQVKGISSDLPYVHQLVLKRVQALQSNRLVDHQTGKPFPRSGRLLIV